jgi:hypothetical protein
LLLWISVRVTADMLAAIQKSQRSDETVSACIVRLIECGLRNAELLDAQLQLREATRVARIAPRRSIICDRFRANGSPLPKTLIDLRRDRGQGLGQLQLELQSARRQRRLQVRGAALVAVLRAATTRAARK